jgi:light-regulated signal transduction histidine kinase (bacteriophytochrome)
MGMLIDDLLAFSRMGRQAMSRARVDLGILADSVWADLRQARPEGEVEFRRGPLPVVTGDLSMLRQVFANLLSNALKYSRGRCPAVIRVEAEDPGAEVVVGVRDNGVGFDMQYAHKLFGVFQRLHSEKEFEGTGVGLAIVDRIVHRHGGRVWAEGTPGAGATFRFSLPASGGDHG